MVDSGNKTPKLENEIKKVAIEMYKKNQELAERNKTLSLLSKIDEIILSSVTEIEQIADQIAQASVAEGGFKMVIILYLDKKSHYLTPLAAAVSKETAELDHELQKILYLTKISLKSVNNPVIKSLKNQKKQELVDLCNILEEQLPKKKCEEIEKKVFLKSILINPLIVRNEVIGSLVIGSGESESKFFQYQSDLLDRLPDVVGIAIDNALLYQKIQNANIRLKELDKLKDEFVSIASHELRTPMTAVKSYLWMALNDKQATVDPKLKNYLDIAYHETEQLIKLVQNMLTISRIEGKRLKLDLIQMNIFDIVKHVYDELKIKADEKKINFSCIPYPETLMIQGDKDKMEEVFQNIIGNALKFTPDGGSIAISFAKADHHVEVSIKDTGPGISKEDMDKLFTKFGRIEKEEKRTPGTGLGLYISKQIVTLHKGIIKVESEVGKGTTFIVSLPLT